MTSPMTTPTFLSKEEMQRRDAVCNKLANDLDRYLANYRTFDKQHLTEGEVIVGLGFLLGLHLKDPERVKAWLAQVGIAGLSAVKDKP